MDRTVCEMTEQPKRAGFQPGQSGNPNGRPKGSKNVFHTKVREAFSLAFGTLQDDPEVNLTEWARKNPDEFYKICSKVIPNRMEGDPADMQITVMTGVPRRGESLDDLA